MMLASQVRANARQSLQGKWGKAALISLVFMVISFLLSLLNVIPIIGGLAVTVISVPLAYGLVAAFMKLKRSEEVSYTTFLSEGFANFRKSMVSYTLDSIKVITLDYSFNYCYCINGYVWSFFSIWVLF